MVAAEVDVLVTVYNGAPYLEAALESLQRQTLEAIRIIVVDDGSTDATPEILRRFASGDARIQVVKQANGGVVEAANRGLSLCTAEFVARLDADDVAAPDRLARQVAVLRAHPSVLAVSGEAWQIGPDGARLGPRTVFPSPAHADPALIPAREPYLLHPFLMVRRDALKKVGGYRPLIVAEDSDLYWRLSEIGGLLNTEDILGDYRMHGASISSASIAGGRIMAISSQLAALSALRRRAGETDLEFTTDYAKAIKAAAGSLAAAVSAASAPLTPLEAVRLRLSASAKLMELASYRPYELEPSDCAFIAEAFRTDGRGLKGRDRSVVVRSLAGTAARLNALGMRQDAQALLPLEARPGFYLRAAVQGVLGKAGRDKLRQMLSPALRRLYRT